MLPIDPVSALTAPAIARADWLACVAVLATIVARVIEANPDVAERVRGGNPKAIGALVGPVMRETKGRADGGEVNRLLREQLGV